MSNANGVAISILVEMSPKTPSLLVIAMLAGCGGQASAPQSTPARQPVVRAAPGLAPAETPNPTPVFSVGIWRREQCSVGSTYLPDFRVHPQSSFTAEEGSCVVGLVGRGGHFRVADNELVLNVEIFITRRERPPRGESGCRTTPELEDTVYGPPRIERHRFTECDEEGWPAELVEECVWDEADECSLGDNFCIEQRDQEPEVDTALSRPPPFVYPCVAIDGVPYFRVASDPDRESRWPITAR